MGTVLFVLILIIVVILLLLVLWSWFYSRAFWREHVRLERFVLEVIGRDGKPQPAGKSYPDTTRIRVRATLILSRLEDLAPFTLTCVMRNHAAKKCTVAELTVKEFGKGRVEVSFTLNSALITEASGIWEGQLQIGQLGICLRKFEIEAPGCRSGLLESLKLKRLEIHVSKDSSRSEESSFAHMSAHPSVSVFVQMVQHDWPAAKYDMPLWGRATHVTTNRAVSLPSTCMVPSCDVLEAWIPCDAVMAAGGEWEIEIGVGETTLGTGSFITVPAREADQRVTVHSFDIGVLDNKGQSTPASETVYASESLSLQPVLTLTTPFPSVLAEYALKLTVLVNGTEAYMHNEPCVLHSSNTSILLPEIPLSELKSRNGAAPCVLQLFLNSKPLVRYRFVLKEAPPAFAAVQAALLEKEMGSPGDEHASQGRPGKRQTAR